MAVYFKFKSAKDYDSIPIDGHFISVANLKEKIVECKHLGKGTDFDLIVANAQTNEEYLDEAMLIPKSTSVIVRRVPGWPRMPIVAKRDESKVEGNNIEDFQTAKSGLRAADSSVVGLPEETEWDEFGNDLYTIPEVLPVQSRNLVLDAPPPNKADEDSKIKALVETPALDWQRQGPDGFGSGRGFGTGMGGRMNGGHGFGHGGLEQKTPPRGYICHRCKVPGHFIQHCPTNGDPNYDIKRVKPPTGIPKSMLMPTPDGSYALPSGAVAVMKPNEAAFDKEMEGLSSSQSVCDLPPELRCPFCKEGMKDAVLTSKCCFKSFCDKCIRNYIISKSICICGATKILADDLVPNKTVRDTINRILESNNSSTENSGSRFQVQDMESAHCLQPKIPSLTLSVASKGEKMQTIHNDRTSDVKDAVNEGKPVISVSQELLTRGTTAKAADISETTLELKSFKEPTLQGSATLAEEEVKQNLAAGEPGKKKRKKARLPVNAIDMLWRTSQDLAAENCMMPLALSGYNPYWADMQLGMDGYMAPFTGAIPYMGYVPGPFDVPFEGMIPQDPFGAQGYMLPVVPSHRDLSVLGMGVNAAPPIMRREKFEAWKADPSRKREIERRGESRERSKDQECGREVSTSGNVPSMKSMCSRERSKDRECGREVSTSGNVPSMKSKPRLTSQAASSYHHRVERGTNPERSSREVEAARHGNGKVDHLQHPEILTDRKQNGRMFTRISFPESDGGSKKRKLDAMETTRTANGYKDDYNPRATESTRHRLTSNGYAPSSERKRFVDDDSSDDDDRHFKRKPSRY